MSRLAGRAFGGPNEQPMLGMDQTGPAQYPDQAQMPETYPMGNVPEPPRQVPVAGQPSPIAQAPAPTVQPVQVGQLSQPQIGGVGSQQRVAVERQRADDLRVAQDRADESAIARRQQYLAQTPYAAF